MGSMMGSMMGGGISSKNSDEPTAEGIPDLGAMLLSPSKENTKISNSVPTSQATPGQLQNPDAASMNTNTSMDLITQMTNALGKSPQGGGTFQNPSSQYDNQGMPLPNNGLNLGNPQNMLNGLGGS